MKQKRPKIRRRQASNPRSSMLHVSHVAYYSSFHSAKEAFLFANYLRDLVEKAVHEASQGRSFSSELLPQGALTLVSADLVDQWCTWWRVAERHIHKDETPSQEFNAGEERIQNLLLDLIGRPVPDLVIPLAGAEKEFSLILREAIIKKSSKSLAASGLPLNDLIRLADRVGVQDSYESGQAVDEIVGLLERAGALPTPFVSGNEETKAIDRSNFKNEKPAWQRLSLHRSTDGSDHDAILDNKKFRIRGDAALKFLDVLQKKKGTRVKAAALQSAIGQRPDRVYRLLEKPLQRIIDPPARGVGYAMK